MICMLEAFLVHICKYRVSRACGWHIKLIAEILKCTYLVSLFQNLKIGLHFIYSSRLNFLFTWPALYQREYNDGFIIDKILFYFYVTNSTKNHISKFVFVYIRLHDGCISCSKSIEYDKTINHFLLLFSLYSLFVPRLQ